MLQSSQLTNGHLSQPARLPPRLLAKSLCCRAIQQSLSNSSTSPTRRQLQLSRGLGVCCWLPGGSREATAPAALPGVQQQGKKRLCRICKTLAPGATQETGAC